MTDTHSHKTTKSSFERLDLLPACVCDHLVQNPIETVENISIFFTFITFITKHLKSDDILWMLSVDKKMDKS